MKDKICSRERSKKILSADGLIDSAARERKTSTNNN